jgi:hypothetical protein
MYWCWWRWVDGPPPKRTAEDRARTKRAVLAELERRRIKREWSELK